MPAEPLLAIKGLNVYFQQSHILQGVDLTIDTEPLSLVGRNGMGKTTLCQAIMGLVTASSGTIRLGGTAIEGKRPHRVAATGIGYVPQGRRIFPSLSVDEHLRLVARGRNARWTVERVYDLFPRLFERRRSGGAALSGGEQQMLAIGRALLTNPKLMIMDEPTEGLAPIVIDHLVEIFRDLVREDMGVLLVEQNLAVATAVSNRLAVMVNGRIALEVPAAEMREDAALQRRYLGVGTN